MKPSIVHFLLLLFLQIASAQTEYPQDYFQSPLDIPLRLSGTFGELRSNHFHSGLDIKTQQRTGLPVKAVANGYVSRIKIQRYGYGKALYVTHPNGYTSVYAHLDRFSDRIEKYVRKGQYDKESYTIQLFPGDLELRVDQGEVIAYSGNSGGSGGPHLHFEIRDAASKPINPFLFGYDVPDTRPPLVKGLMVYPLDEFACINGKNEPQEIRLIPAGNNVYKSPQLLLSGKIGFAINTNDRQNTGPNQNGIYRMTGLRNGTQFYEVTFDTYSFGETRYLNNMIDYERYKTQKRRYTKLFRSPTNPLSLYKQIDNNGIIDFNQPGMDNTILVNITDFKGNLSQVVMDIKNDSLMSQPASYPDPESTLVTITGGFSGNFGKFDLNIPAGALYEDASLMIRQNYDTLQVHQDIVPLHKSMVISYDARDCSPKLLNKTYIARQAPWGTLYHVDTNVKQGKLKAFTRTLGTYTIDRDTVPPTIAPLNFRNKQWISNHKKLQLKIDDEKSGIKGYRATVNGTFILMEYDYKTDMLTHYFSDGVVKDTENHLKVIVTDNVGNSATFESVFYRK